MIEISADDVKNKQIKTTTLELKTDANE